MRAPLSLLALLAAAPALAGGQAEIPPDPVTEIAFDTVDVNAPIHTPSAALVVERRRPVFHPMIRLRATFAPELQATTTLL